MSQTTAHNPEPDDRTPAVEVDVARSGGVAGLTRHWTVQPPETEAPAWISLIDRCPWDDAAPHEEPMPDGFVWLIRATWPGTAVREAELPDDAVVGAWRDLVDAVRNWNRRRSGPGRPGR